MTDPAKPRLSPVSATGLSILPLGIVLTLLGTTLVEGFLGGLLTGVGVVILGASIAVLVSAIRASKGDDSRGWWRPSGDA
ncbi:hypothetical protein ACGGZK_06915 [Agromyces sp. MMS24-K17]|uniref:hypothetical protein n=1 Tax=Agromyces sp. MMS24-K17 TaxID=3372850 RepID=UPI003754F5C6